jgi:hypothetical protein
MDFVVGLPPSVIEPGGIKYTNIMIITDRLSKQRHFIPCDKIDALSVARLFHIYVWKYHGFSKTVVFDRGI